MQLKLYTLPFLHLNYLLFLRPWRLRYAWDIWMYSSLTNSSKTHIANEVACLPLHNSVKVDFVARNLFYPTTIKTASVYRLASTDAETTENPASFYEAKPLCGFTHVVGGFSVVVKTLRIMWYYKSVVYSNFVWRYREVNISWSWAVVSSLFYFCRVLPHNQFLLSNKKISINLISG